MFTNPHDNQGREEGNSFLNIVDRVHYLGVHITQSKGTLTYHRTRLSGCVEAQVLKSFESLGTFEIVWL